MEFVVGYGGGYDWLRQILLSTVTESVKYINVGITFVGAVTIAFLSAKHSVFSIKTSNFVVAYLACST